MRSALPHAILLFSACASPGVVEVVEPLAPAVSTEETDERWERAELLSGESTLADIDYMVQFRFGEVRAFERRVTDSPGPYGEFEVTYSFPEREWEIVFLLDANERYLWGEGFRDLRSPYVDRWIVGQSTADEVRAALEGTAVHFAECYPAGTGHYEFKIQLEGERALSYWFDRFDRLYCTPWDPELSERHE